MQLIKEFESKFIGKNKINFNIGDTIKVHTKIIEGEKERVQVFTGIVIAIKGHGISKTFTVYRSAYGCSMERVFLINSPRITKIEIERKGKVRKSKLYYLRGTSGKKSRVKEQLFKKVKKGAVAEEKAPVEKEPKIEEALKEPIKEEKKIEAKKEEEKPKKKAAPKKPKEEKPEEKKPKEE